MDYKISIIITARNYGRYLAECIDSCLNQTVKPLEVIYSDDCSEDNSVNIANNFSIKVVEHKTHIGVVEARNNAVDLSSGNILIHVDGDDILTPEYIERCLEVFNESTPFVYTCMDLFGDYETTSKEKSWGIDNIYDCNIVNTSFMCWKDVFYKAGKWQENKYKTVWDWDLVLRMMRFGTPKRSAARLLYRQHPISVTKKFGCETEKVLKLYQYIRQRNLYLTIGCVYSGRITELFDEWMTQLVRDIEHLAHKPQLILVNNSDIDLNQKISKYINIFNIKIINFKRKLNPKLFDEKKNQVGYLLAECCNFILENATGNVIHFREDDIIPIDGDFKKMVDFITSGEKTPNAVGGLYFNRHKEYPRFIGGNFSEPILQTQDISSLDSLTSPIKVDFTGTGMLLFWKNTCPKYFSFQVKGLGWHDWAWCYDLKILGGDLFILPEVYCKHYTDKDNYVRPDLNNYLSSEEIEPKIIFKDMEELMVLGTGKKLQNSVNKLLKSGWHIKEMNPRKQPIFSSNDVENIEEVMKAISDSKPVELKLKSGTSIQNACLNYETIEVILTKE